jgi:hypothetical protein
MLSRHFGLHYERRQCPCVSVCHLNKPLIVLCDVNIDQWEDHGH